MPPQQQPQPQQHRPSWLVGAPATKLWTTWMVLSYVVVHRGRRRSAADPYAMDAARIVQHGETFRFFTSKLTFGNMPHLILGTLLLAWWSRKFEREMGSIKFCSFCCIVQALAVALEAAWVYWFSSTGAAWTQLHYMGPYPLLGALATLFYRFTPRQYPQFVSVAGWNFSEKSLYYLWMMQVVGVYQSSSATCGVWIVTALGALAATIYLQVPALQQWEPPALVVSWIQPWVERWTEPPPRMLVGGTAGTGTTSTTAAGAGSTRNRGGGGARPAAAAAAAPRHPVFGNAAPDHLTPRQVAATQRHPPPPDPAALEQLQAMGFDRQDAVAALQFTNNDVNRAADRLLQQMQ